MADTLRFLVLALMCSMAVACSTIKYETLRNETEAPLHAKVHFDREGNRSQVMAFELAPGESTGWQYEVGRFRKVKIDPQIRKMVFSVSGDCTVTYGRDDLKRIVEPKGYVIVKRDLAKCDP